MRGLYSTDGSYRVSRAGLHYETVAASQTDQALGPTGAVGDELHRLVIIPGTTSPGAVSVQDSTAGAAITIFPGGASSVTELRPMIVDLDMTSTAGKWFITTGANVTAIAVGRFT